MSSDKVTPQQLLEQIRASINPNGDEKINSYIDSTLNYLQSLYEKMNNTDDQDKTSKEIAADLSGKVEKWLQDKKNDKNDKNDKQ